MIARFIERGGVTPKRFAAVAQTVTLLSGSSRALSTAVTVTVPALAVLPAGIVSTRRLLRAKSPAAAFVPGVADTVTVVSAVDARSRLAVTAAEFEAPLSEMDGGESDSVTAGRSSSVIVSAAPETNALRLTGRGDPDSRSR